MPQFGESVLAGPFARQLKEVYSKGTLLPDEMNSGGDSTGSTPSSSAKASRYLLCINEVADAKVLPSV